MKDVERLLQRLGDAEPDPRLTQLGTVVMVRIALLPIGADDGGILRWSSFTAVAALIVGTAIGSLSNVGVSSARTVPVVSAGLALAPSTLLASSQ